MMCQRILDQSDLVMQEKYESNPKVTHLHNLLNLSNALSFDIQYMFSILVQSDQLTSSYQLYYIIHYNFEKFLVNVHSHKYTL